MTKGNFQNSDEFRVSKEGVIDNSFLNINLHSAPINSAENHLSYSHFLQGSHYFSSY
jgi:hypothetical protein